MGSAGTRDGVGDFQGLESPWPPSVCKRTPITCTNHQKISRYGTAQERIRREHEGQEDMWIGDLRRESPQVRKGPGHMLRPVGEGGDLIQWRQKDGTNKVTTKGVNRYVAALKAVEGEQMDEGRGDTNGHAARGCKGREGRWGSGLGRKYSERRDGQWRPEVEADRSGRMTRWIGNPIP